MKRIKKQSYSPLRNVNIALLVTLTLALTGALYAAEAGSIPLEKSPITVKGGPVAPSEFVAGEIIVVFEENVTSAVIETVVEGVGGEIAEVSVLDPSRVVVSVPEGQEDEYIDAYSQLDTVRTAEKNYVYKTQSGSEPSKHETSIGE